MKMDYIAVIADKAEKIEAVQYKNGHVYAYLSIYENGEVRGIIPHEETYTRLFNAVQEGYFNDNNLMFFYDSYLDSFVAEEGEGFEREIIAII